MYKIGSAFLSSGVKFGNGNLGAYPDLYLSISLSLLTLCYFVVALLQVNLLCSLDILKHMKYDLGLYS